MSEEAYIYEPVFPNYEEFDLVTIIIIILIEKL